VVQRRRLEVRRSRLWGTWLGAALEQGRTQPRMARATGHYRVPAVLASLRHRGMEEARLEVVGNVYDNPQILGEDETE
jgi:hypothetical protein